MPPDKQDDAPVAVTLPDGAVKRFPHAVTGEEIAKSIGPGLAKAAPPRAFSKKVRMIWMCIRATAPPRSSKTIQPY